MDDCYIFLKTKYTGFWWKSSSGVGKQWCGLEAVWQLYELYETVKRSANGFDLPDVVHHVYWQLLKRPLEHPFNFLYVDEVQEEGQAQHIFQLLAQIINIFD